MYAVIGVCAGLAFLTKGVIGPALMCAPPILAAAAMREWEYVKRVLPRAAAAATAGVAAFGIPWVVALVNTPGGGWPAVETCLWANTFGRSVAEDGAQFSAHVKPPHYYLLAWFYVVGPWCLALPAVLKAGVLSRGGRGGRTLFLGLVFVAGLALLSVPSTKREIYLLPFVPVASVVLGVWLSRVGRSAGGAWDAAALKTLGIVATTAFVAVTLALGYVALGLPLPPSAPGSSDPSTFDLLAAERGAVAWYCVAAGAWTLTVHAWIKRRLVPREARGLQVAAGVFTTFVVLHGAGFPAFDPVRDMSEGAREIASLVPEGEPVLTLRGDETLWSIVPFYTGRAVENAATSPQAITAIDAGRATHVVVPEKHDERITPALRERLVFVRSVRLNSTRTVDVYRVRAP
jgi:4-amino-4-deoxy-L-arabinose transferase-like glycosyltransferase